MHSEAAESGRRSGGEQFFAVDEVLRVLYENEKGSVRALFRNVWSAVLIFLVALMASTGGVDSISLPIVTVKLTIVELLSLAIASICYFSARGFYHALAATYYENKKREIAALLGYNRTAIDLMTAMSYAFILRKTRDVIDVSWQRSYLAVVSWVLRIIAKFGGILASTILLALLCYLHSIEIGLMVTLAAAIAMTAIIEWIILKGRIQFASFEEANKIFDLNQVPALYDPRKTERK